MPRTYNTFEIGNAVGQYAVLPTGTVGLYNISGQTLQAIKDMMAVSRTNLYEAEFTKITNRAITNNDRLVVYRDVPVEEFVTRELNLPPLRTFGAGTVEAA